jgi:hypothetical protein
MMQYLHNSVQDNDIAFVMPEVWDSWVSYHAIVDKTIEIMLKAASLDFVNTQSAKDALCLLIVQIRWTISRLVALENSKNS